MKDAGMRIRIEPHLRDEFLKICHEENLPAAHVIRTLMRNFIAHKQFPNLQFGLFPEYDNEKTK